MHFIPILFGLFINYLGHHINKLDVGLPHRVSLLAMSMFAVHIVLTAENECHFQCLGLLVVLHEWCVNWEVQINPKKTSSTFKSESSGHCTVSLVVLTHLPTLRSISTLVFEHLAFIFISVTCHCDTQDDFVKAQFSPLIVHVHLQESNGKDSKLV